MFDTPIQYFGSVSVGIFPGFPQPIHTIPKENSVGTFWYCTFGGNPFFPSKGGFCPLFDGSSPFFEEKISSRQISKKEFFQNFTKCSSPQIVQYKKYRTEYQPASAGNLPITAKLPVNRWSTTLVLICIMFSSFVKRALLNKLFYKLIPF